MKKLLKNIFITTFAVYLMVVGIGYNVMKYCSYDCNKHHENIFVTLCKSQHKGTEKEKCCGFEHHKCCEKEATAEHCKLIYLKADFPVFENSENIKFEPKEIDLPLIVTPDFYSVDFFISKNTSFFFHEKIPLCGREILAQSEILII